MDKNSNGVKTNNEKKVPNCYLKLGDDWECLLVQSGLFRNTR